jgi:hypothetical protein
LLTPRPFWQVDQPAARAPWPEWRLSNGGSPAPRSLTDRHWDRESDSGKSGDAIGFHLSAAR